MGLTRINSVSIRCAITAIWLLTFGWLLRFEAFPEYFTHTLSGYKGLLSNDVLIQDSWMKITFSGAPIGYSHTTVETQEDHPLAFYRVLNRSYMRLTVMGIAQPIYVDTEAQVDISQTLQGFNFAMSSRSHKVNIEARRRTGDTFDVKITTGHTVQHTQVEVPPDVVLYSPMTEMGLRRLKPGQALTIRTLDPASLSPVNLNVKAIRRETLRVGENDYETTLLEMAYQGATIKSWLDDKGVMVRQETPFGWTMETCSATEAFDAVSHKESAPDILAALAVRCHGVISDPRNTTRVTYRVRGVDMGPESWRTSRQIADVGDDGFVTLTVNASSASAPDEALPAGHVFLKATSFVQSDHEALRSKAAEITKSARSPAEKADVIFDWVYENVRKEPTVSLPSAVDVLKTMVGDCNEHTYLYVGLARAAGLPAKIMVGLAYHKGAFYYHAWPAVYVGHWVEMDPTWGQRYVDATHIRITEGELASQLELVQTVGMLSLEIVEQEQATY